MSLIDSKLLLICAYVAWNRCGTFSDNGYVVKSACNSFLAPDSVGTKPPESGNDGRRSFDVFYSSASPEWYTPRHIIDCALDVLGTIDLDPCSNSKADPNVPAKTHYTKDDDGLKQTWAGRVYMNPPYGREIGSWVQKLHDAYQTQQISEAIALLPARTDTQWFRTLQPYLKCFIAGRLKFGDAQNSAPFPSVVVYLGDQVDRFADAFQPLGDIYARLSNRCDRSHEEYSMEKPEKDDRSTILPHLPRLLLTEDELIDVLRIPEIFKGKNPHNVIDNLKRMHGLPCIHICYQPLYPVEAIHQWIMEKIEKEQK